MKKLFRICFCGVLLLAVTVFGGGAASAHTMPESEAVLIYPLAQGSRAFTAEFKINMPLEKASAVLGRDFKEEEREISNFRVAYYKYKYPDITFIGRHLKSHKGPSGDLPISSILCRSRSLKTPSGFRVGDPYENVRAMYGEGSVSNSASPQHTYWFDGIYGMTFVVDEQGLIKEIDLHVAITG